MLALEAEFFPRAVVLYNREMAAILAVCASWDGLCWPL